ncbi:ComEC/Rec2 family competence protein [Niabella hibiscisoli]|uniref:ComEC/Rec2 family competence protein n=1 Tax=Niabella hibiscisoli TaxID=1825928 RepID=UPI001F0FCC4A|nr:hypothetical protein [Niabella hibiscisoli]MCH5719522.1 hypothetical protein [Niabella hibiscisoli]
MVRQVRKHLCITLFISFILLSRRANAQLYNGSGTRSEIGKALAKWEQGYLDIHAINTGRGECTLFIFPDGTTMMVDAAGSLISPTADIPPPAQKPDGSISPGTAIADYVKFFIKTASNKLNYIMLSHFDPDHMGTFSTSLPTHCSGDFRMGGVTEVGAAIRFDKIIDRGYPSYNFPSDLKSDSGIIDNYIKFVAWAKSSYHASAEQFAVGRNDQIVLVQRPLAYKNFEIRNLVANGIVWNGNGTGVTNALPSASELVAAKASENVYSIGFELSYGKFNYFSGGDLQYNGRSTHNWKDIESPVANVVSAVDVMKANHHGTANCNSEALLKKLNPQTVVIHTWRDIQPNPQTIARMYAVNSNCRIFTTNMTEANKPRLATDLARIKAQQGHVVVRVKPGGDSYSIYVLDDNNQEYKVTKMFGPYQSI